MGIIIWATFGGLTGWIVNELLDRPDTTHNMVWRGVIGGLTAGWLAAIFTVWPTLIGINWASTIIPMSGGAVAAAWKHRRELDVKLKLRRLWENYEQKLKRQPLPGLIRPKLRAH